MKNIFITLILCCLCIVINGQVNPKASTPKSKREALEDALYASEKKAFEAAEEVILSEDSDADSDEFKMYIFPKSWEMNNTRLEGTGYIFRVKKYNAFTAAYDYENILVDVKEGLIKHKYYIPNESEIYAVANDSIHFSNEVLVFVDGRFYDSAFYADRDAPRYRFTGVPLLKSTTSGMSKDGLGRDEGGVFDDAPYNITTRYDTVKGELKMEIFFDSVKSYTTTAEKKTILQGFTTFMHQDVLNENHRFWVEALQQALTQVKAEEIEAIEPWDGLKYDLGNSCKVHLYFLNQYNNSTSKSENKLVIEIVK